MPPMIDPDARRRYADDILTQAAERLEGLLQETARALQPFPAFPGAFFTYGVEVDLEGVEDRNVGCVVVTEEGTLRELQIGFESEDPFAQADLVAMRDERLVEVRFTPQDRLRYAYAGLRAITRLLREQAADRPAGAPAHPPADSPVVRSD